MDLSILWNRLCFVLLAASAALGAAACGAAEPGAEGDHDSPAEVDVVRNEELVADAPMRLEDNAQGVARDDVVTLNAARNLVEINISVDSTENNVEAPVDSFYCKNCKVKCYDSYYNLVGTWSRGPHNDCQGEAVAFCRDAFGLPYGVGSCG